MFDKKELTKMAKKEFPFEYLYVEQKIYLCEEYQEEHKELMECGEALIYEKELCIDEYLESLYDSIEKKETKYKSDLDKDIINLFYGLSHYKSYVLFDDVDDLHFYYYCLSRIKDTNVRDLLEYLVD